VSEVVYLDTSAVLRAVLERGLTPEMEQQLADARFLVTSRLALVESARAFARLRSEGQPESRLAEAEREADSIWARCTLWELTPAVCEFAQAIQPAQPLRTLDALHLATWLLVRRRLGVEVTLMTSDERLKAASLRI
jgi:predicted nucleic acid-binding protein